MMDPLFVADVMVKERRADLARDRQDERRERTRWTRLMDRVVR